ncbi:hypothetical protein ACLB2K_003447 [Fragaria x ananassa]
MKYRSTSPPQLRSAKLLCVVRHETGYLSDSEILIQGSDSSEQEEQEGPEGAQRSYSLEDLLGDNLLFCSICGEEDHWVYNCEKYYEKYKCPYGTEYIPPGITQHDEKLEKPSAVWTDSDEEYLRSLSGGFYHMVGLSELKNIHRIMINQHNDIEAVVRAGIQPKCAADYEHRTMKKAAMKDEEKDKE